VARDRQRNRQFFGALVRGVSNSREGSKILTFLFRSPPGVQSSLLHLRSTWKVNSAKLDFRFTAFYEVRELGILRTPHPENSHLAYKIVHRGMHLGRVW
jgi:hypothetical protein